MIIIRLFAYVFFLSTPKGLCQDVLGTKLTNHQEQIVVLHLGNKPLTTDCEVDRDSDDQPGQHLISGFTKIKLLLQPIVGY